MIKSSVALKLGLNTVTVSGSDFCGPFFFFFRSKKFYEYSAKRTVLRTINLTYSLLGHTEKSYMLLVFKTCYTKKQMEEILTTH